MEKLTIRKSIKLARAETEALGYQLFSRDLNTTSDDEYIKARYVTVRYSELPDDKKRKWERYFSESHIAC